MWLLTKYRFTRGPCKDFDYLHICFHTTEGLVYIVLLVLFSGDIPYLVEEVEIVVSLTHPMAPVTTQILGHLQAELKEYNGLLELRDGEKSEMRQCRKETNF